MKKYKKTSMGNDNVDFLKKFGLSTYESMAYITLTSLITATATEISENSCIPRPKIYQTLKSLHEKNFIEIERGRPLKFTVINPQEIFTREKQVFLENLEEVQAELNEIYENQISKVQAPMWLIHGEEKIIKKELEIISRAKKSINMRIGFLFENELEQLIEVFKKKSNIEINILTAFNLYYNNKKIDLTNFINQKNIHIKKTNISNVKMLIRDEKELFHIYAKFTANKKSVIPLTSIGAWNQYEDIAKNYNDRFIDQFYNKKNRHKK